MADERFLMRRPQRFFSENVLEHDLIQAQVGHHTLELGVLLVKLPQPVQLAHADTAVRLLPRINVACAMPILRRASSTEIPVSA